MSDEGSTGAGADLAERGRLAQEKAHLFSNRLRNRLRNMGATIASVAAIGAIIGGLTGYWNAWRVISNDFLKTKTPSQTAGLIVSKGPSVAVLPITNPTKAAELEPAVETTARILPRQIQHTTCDTARNRRQFFEAGRCQRRSTEVRG